MSKSVLNKSIALLLTKLQERLNRVGAQAHQTADEFASFRDWTRVNIGKLAEEAGRAHDLSHSRECLTGKNEADFRSRIEVVERAARHGVTQLETLRASVANLGTDTRQSLNKLAESTQKGFDGVKLDVEKIIRALQTANARMSELESRIKAMEESSKTYTADVQKFERVRALLREITE